MKLIRRSGKSVGAVSGELDLTEMLSAAGSSERGTRVAALFYSLIESAKLCGVEPRAYLREPTLRAVRNPGSVTLAGDLKSPES